MFGYRSDGKRVKDVSLLFRIIPHIMKERNDAEVFFKQDIPLKGMDRYIEAKAGEGIKFSYMGIIYAAAVKTIAQRPSLNRFIIDGRIYDRNDIILSVMIKKSMDDSGEETAVKIKFTGKESIFEIKEKLDNAVAENKQKEMQNSMDKFVKVLGRTPNIVLKIVVGLLKKLDKWGMLPKPIIALSPFHTSAFLTNVASIGIDAIFHHIYDFGTTGIFLAMGKKKKSYIYDDDILKVEKCISLAFVGDERICDGFYFASSMKSFRKYLKKPELLEEHFSNEKKQQNVAQEAKEVVV